MSQPKQWLRHRAHGGVKKRARETWTNLKGRRPISWQLCANRHQAWPAAKGAIRSIVVRFDSELAQVGDKRIRLRRSDTALALRERQDIRDFDRPPTRHQTPFSVASRFSKAAVFGVASSWKRAKPSRPNNPVQTPHSPAAFAKKMLDLQSA